MGSGFKVIGLGVRAESLGFRIWGLKLVGLAAQGFVISRHCAKTSVVLLKKGLSQEPLNVKDC